MNGELVDFVKSAELRDVFLKSQNSNCIVLPRSIHPKKMSLDFDFNFGFEIIDKDNFLISTISLRVKGIENDSKTSQFEICSEYVLVYSYENYKGEIDDNLCIEFCKTTALFNAYPYLREAIQTTSCKMGVPPIIAPLLKIEPPQRINKVEASHSEQGKRKISRKLQA